MSFLVLKLNQSTAPGRFQFRGSSIYFSLLTLLLIIAIMENAPTQIHLLEYQKINQSLTLLHEKILKYFNFQEKQLLDHYQQQIQSATQQIQSLEKTNSETEINKKIKQHKLLLEKEKEKHINTAIQYSEKNKQLKNKLNQTLNKMNQYESQLKFLQQQILRVECKNLYLKQKYQKTVSFQYPPNQQQLNRPQFQKINKKKKKKSIKSLQRMYQIQLQNNKKLSQLMNTPTLELTELEFAFKQNLESFLEIRDIRKVEQLPLLESKLSNFQKRSLMKNFLQRVEIKEMIYRSIFQKKNPSNYILDEV